MILGWASGPPAPPHRALTLVPSQPAPTPEESLLFSSGPFGPKLPPKESGCFQLSFPLGLALCDLSLIQFRTEAWAFPSQGSRVEVPSGDRGHLPSLGERQCFLMPTEGLG